MLLVNLLVKFWYKINEAIDSVGLNPAPRTFIINICLEKNAFYRKCT
jgi:hypothetical protein